MTEWIKCKEQMPENFETVLIYYRMHRKDGDKYEWNIATAYFDDSNYLYDCWVGYVPDPDCEFHKKLEIPLRFVTYWSELPKPPEGK